MKPFRVTSVLLAAATGLAWSLTTVPPVSAGAAATPGEAGVGKQSCPSTVIVVARGNQAGEDLSPRRYSQTGQFGSNGQEGERLGRFFSHLEQRYSDRNGGRSLLDGTYVLGLAQEYYPAEIPIPDDPEGAELLHLIPQAGTIVHGMAAGLAHSVQVGTPGARRAIEDYERDTGCRPRYILFGYSLGAVVLPPQEQWLAGRGQLAGAVYAGSPFQGPADRQMIGVAPGTTGLLGQLPTGPEYRAHTDHRVFYCLSGDLVCDPSPDAFSRSITEDGGGPHARYFLPDETGRLDPGVDTLADTLAAWIAGQRQP